jgi:hypothetical protein
MASTLDAPPPSLTPPTTAGIVSPSFVLMKVDGPSKNQLPIAHAITTRAAAGINNCYSVALSTAPTTAGKVVMQIVFDAIGGVTMASDYGSTLKGPILACISNALLSMSLNGPLPDGGKQGGKAAVTLQLAPATTGPGYGATTDPAWLAKATPRHR